MFLGPILFTLNKPQNEKCAGSGPLYYIHELPLQSKNILLITLYIFFTF